MFPSTNPGITQDSNITLSITILGNSPQQKSFVFTNFKKSFKKLYIVFFR